MTERRVRVRFAPSPTGALHIGGVRTALYNYLFARQHGGDMIFRIEDTDSNRFVPGAEEYILESFKWLGIPFDEGVSFGGEHGPYRQSERREIYKKYVKVLLDAGKAYIAFDTPEELEAKRAEIANFQYDASTRMQMRNSLTLSKEEVDALSFIVFAGSAYDRGRKMCAKLKEEIPRQLFEIPIQAAVGSKIIARETVKAMRKDVLAKCYGGDISRKKKLLEKQKEGKKRMRQVGNVEIPQKAFMSVLKLDED